MRRTPLTRDVADHDTHEWVACNALAHGRSATGDVWAQLMLD
jgi:hypothetical protein